MTNPASIAGVDHAATQVSLSGDGHTALFVTTDALVSADTNSRPDVYVADVVTGKVSLVSRLASGAASGLSDGATAELTRDGKTAFVVTTGALASRAGIRGSGLLAVDIATGSVVAIEANGIALGKLPDGASADGQVLSLTTMQALVPGTPGRLQAYLIDRRSGTVRWLTAAHSYEVTPGTATSPDGRFTAFVDPVGSKRQIAIFDATTGTQQDIAPRNGELTSVLAIADDGSRVLGMSAKTDCETRVLDVATSMLLKLPHPAGCADIAFPTMSGDGNKVAFTTSAWLSSPPVWAPSGDKVWLADLAANTVVVANQATDGTIPSGSVISALSISSDGGTIAFTTTGSSMPGDAGPGPWSYVRTLAR
jgi:Tol biopolymer transport system component